MLKITYMLLGFISMIAIVGTTSISSHAFAQIIPANSTNAAISNPVTNLNDIQSSIDSVKGQAAALQGQLQSLQSQAQSLQNSAQSLGNPTSNQSPSQLNDQSTQSSAPTSQPNSIFGQ